MIETVMLYVALAVTEPSGNTIDEEFRVMSRHFDTEQECEDFINNWKSFIETRASDTAQTLLKDGYKAKITELGCTKL
tara:strand:- start:33 stop:266 length:234 start_codon:yes stop_codon:yes gene_type:complete